MIADAFELFSHQRDQVMKVAIFPHGQSAGLRSRPEALAAQC